MARDRGGDRLSRDYSELERTAYVRDGTSYVVEFLRDNAYRTFLVDNPADLPSPSADKMLAVMFLVRGGIRRLEYPREAA